MPLIWCPKCESHKPPQDFRYSRTRRDPYCSSCMDNLKRQYWATEQGQATMKAANKRAYLKRRGKKRCEYINDVCVYCNNTKGWRLHTCHRSQHYIECPGQR